MFRRPLRSFLINLSSLWLVSRLIPGINIDGGIKTLVTAAIVLAVVNFTIKPLVNLLLLPINLLTLGTFRWLVNVIVLYLVTIIVPHLKIGAFQFPGFTYQGFIMPAMYLSTFWVFVLTSFLISLITSFLLWLVE